MKDDQKEFKLISSRPPIFQTGDRYVVMGRDFLGVNGTEVESCPLFQGEQERSVRIGGKEIRIRVESKIEIGPYTYYITLRMSEAGTPLMESVHTFIKIREIVADYKNWPLMLFKPKEILISHYHGQMSLSFLCFDRVSLRLLNKSLKEVSTYGPVPWVVWNHRYQDGPDHIKLVYIEYHHYTWKVETVVGDRQCIDNKITPGYPKMIFLLHPSRFNKAAELWTYRNGKRTQTIIFGNYTRQRDKNFTLFSH